MPATILDYTAGTTERGVKIQNSQIFRKIKNDTWTRVQVGVRWLCDDDPGTNPSAGSQFALGLCNGDAEGMGSSNRKHILVASNVDTSNVATGFTRNVSSDIFSLYTNLGVGATSCKFVNNVHTSASGTIQSINSTYRILQSGLSTTFNATIFIVDILRDVSNTYSIRVFSNDNGGAGVTTTRAAFLQQIESTTPALTSYSLGPYRTIAVDEATDGVLDHFHFYWNRSAPSIILLDTAVAKIA